MEREGFVFYQSFWKAVAELDAENFKSCVKAICEYGLYGKSDAEGIAKTVLELVKPQIEANNKRYENGKKGGRKTKTEESETKANQNETKLNQAETKTNQSQPKEKDKEKVKEKDKEKVKEKELDFLPLISDFSGMLQEAVKDWMAYKGERREKYTATGLKNWIGQINNYRKRYSDKSIAGIISRSMAQQYKGVVWDWLKDEPHKPEEEKVIDTGPKDMLSPEEQAAKVRAMNERLGGMFGT